MRGIVQALYWDRGRLARRERAAGARALANNKINKIERPDRRSAGESPAVPVSAGESPAVPVKELELRCWTKPLGPR
jgi:hypothetical protein